jgi:hypothetical protein
VCLAITLYSDYITPMPAPLDVDREQVRMLVLSVGVREAARQCNLSENTVLAWANRGGWLDAIKDALRPQSLPQLPQSMRPTVAIGAIKPVDALANTLLDDSKATKVAASRFARRVVEYSADMEPEIALEQARNVKEAVTIAEKVHGWGQNSGPERISIYGGQVAIVQQVAQDDTGPVIDAD